MLGYPAPRLSPPLVAVLAKRRNAADDDMRTSQRAICQLLLQPPTLRLRASVLHSAQRGAPPGGGRNAGAGSSGLGGGWEVKGC